MHVYLQLFVVFDFFVREKEEHFLASSPPCTVNAALTLTHPSFAYLM